MTKFFTFLGKKIEQYPFRFLMGILAVFAIFLALGIPQIELATGNDTLVQEDNNAYQSNKEMEEEFGGDAVIVLFEDETGEHLLSIENLEKMWNVEQKLQYEEGIFTIISPASMVHHMSKMQSEMMIEQVDTMSEGLETIGEQLVSISSELDSIEMANPQSLGERFNNIAQVTERLNQFSKGQDGLNLAGTRLEEGLNATSSGLGQMSSKMKDSISQNDEESNPADQIAILADNLATISENLGNMGQNTSQIQEASNQTSQALSMMDETFETEFASIQEELQNFQNINPAMFDQMAAGLSEMGNQILTMSEGNPQLSEIGNQLVGMGTELGLVEMADTSVIEDRLNNISQATGQFDQLIQGQDGLKQAGTQLEEGLNATSGGLREMVSNLQNFTSQMGDQSQTAAQLGILADNLSTISENLGTMGQNTVRIQEGSSQTSQGLNMIGETMETEFATIQNEMAMLQNMDPEMFQQMGIGLGEIGNQLIQMSEGLGMFVDNSSMMEANFPTTQEALDNMLYEDENHTELRPMFEQLLPDEEHTQMMIRLEGEDVVSQSEVDEIIKNVNSIIEVEEFETVSPTVSGRPVLDSSLRSEMQQNMVQMVVMAVVIMIVIMVVIFNVRWRLMPLVTIFIAVIATIGLMSVLGVPITMVSMAVFPILIGLGINYSIQFQNRYSEDLSTSVTIKNVGKAVAVSVIATMLGFISLYISPVPMIQDFGAMLTIGVALALISALFILMPTLEIRDVFTSRNKGSADKEEDDKLSGGLDLSNFYVKLAKIIIRFRIPILIMAVVLGIAGFYVDSKVGVETNIETFMPQDMDALEDIRYVRDIMGSADQLTLHVQDDKSVVNSETLDWMDEKIKELENSYSDIITNTQSINSIIEVLPNSEEIENIKDFEETINNLPENQRKLLISEDNTETLITLFTVNLDTEELDSFISELENDLVGAPVDVSITGPSVLDVELVDGLTSGRVQMTLLGLGLVYITLLIIYRSFTRPLATVLPVLIIVGISSGIMYLLGIDFTPITSTLGALILGMGTEMNVMVLERYLEERYFGLEKHVAIQMSTALIGRANLASALTTIGGFSVLIFSDFVILKDFGLMTVINVSLATLSTFIIVPALIFSMDKILFKKKERESLKP